MAGIFYLGKNLMPNPDEIDVTWMKTQVKPQMSREQVASILGGNAGQTLKGGIGNSEVWMYTDRYDPNLHMSIEFADGHVVRVTTDK